MKGAWLPKPGKTYSTHYQEEGETWLISYADMVTLLLGFFVMLFSMSTIDQEKTQRMSKEISSAFQKDAAEEVDDSEIVTLTENQLRAIKVLLSLSGGGRQGSDQFTENVQNKAQTKSDGKNLAAAINSLPGKFKSQFADLQITGIEKRSYKIIVPNEILFEPGREYLMKNSQKRILDFVARLKTIQNIETIMIVGHTDSRPISGDLKKARFSSNLALSSARSAEIAQLFIKNGFAARQVSASGQGESQPLFQEIINSKPNLENMQKNRRVEITINLRGQ